MKENKQNLILIALIVGFIILLIVVVVALADDSSKTPQNIEVSNQDDMSGHHESAAPDENAFNSLLGKVAPNFNLKSYDDKEIELEKLRGKKVVIFFTEGLMCYPACWNQMAAFGQDSAFNNKDVVTLNIAVDNKNEWKDAVEKMPELAKTTVLFDNNRSVSNEYGVLTLASSMHKGQYPGHTYLILDRKGIVKFIYDDPQMGVRNDELKKELEKIE
ncbi:MAG: redoxin domain-containing protein [Candidatus Levybacteria bacterium]|nr:redoxin domain-containing protein [Candidatus Levybacteria bacterium]